MNSSTPPDGFQPITWENNRVIQVLDPWETTRVIEQETDRLLNECFPGWATHGDPAQRDEWRLLCQELLLQSGTLICDAWQILHPEGKSGLYGHTTSRGILLVINLQADDEYRQVYLVTTVLFELKRKRRMGITESGEVFTFFDTLRRTYRVPANTPYHPPAQLPGQFAAFFVRAWKPDLIGGVTAPDGPDHPWTVSKK